MKWSWTAAILALCVAAPGCDRPGDRALAALDEGLDSLVALVERRDRGDLDEEGFVAALAAWERNARKFERLSFEAARSAGPEERRDLMRRWQALSTRLGARLSAISSQRHTLDE